MNTDLACVLTTIQPPTASVRALGQRLAALGANLIVIGDRKGPASFDLPPHEFLPLAAQLALPFAMAKLLPTGHYARKNLGYLLAIARAAPCIYETDDDNAPDGAHWGPRPLRTPARPVPTVPGRTWCNVYRLFTDDLIWPRGMPLDLIRDPATFAHDASTPLAEFEAPIQQGLADLAPDVDAVWRLILDRPFDFQRRPSVRLAPGTWCPFNSQTTWWWPAAYPLMYLPSYCTFRMTDIWRSFVAQRCLWEMGHGLIFHASEVVQERNAHNLMRDFKDEIPGYEGNAQIVRLLADLRLEPGPDAVTANLAACYRQLIAGGFFPERELELLNAWIADLRVTI